MTDIQLLDENLLAEIRDAMTYLSNEFNENPPSLSRTSGYLSKNITSIYPYWHKICLETKLAQNGEVENEDYYFDVTSDLKSAVNYCNDLSAQINEISLKHQRMIIEFVKLNRENVNLKIILNRKESEISNLLGQIEQFEKMSPVNNLISLQFDEILSTKREINKTIEQKNDCEDDYQNITKAYDGLRLHIKELLQNLDTTLKNY
jgi:hypothetical protein